MMARIQKDWREAQSIVPALTRYRTRFRRTDRSDLWASYVRGLYRPSRLPLTATHRLA
jgi:hypothetical protein